MEKKVIKLSESDLHNIIENAVKQIIKEEMENAFPLLVPLKTDIGVGRNWLAAH